MFSAAVLVVASSMAVGQAAPLPSNYEHLKMYETLIGTWVYDGPLLEDVPQFGLKKGTPARCESIYSWGSEKNVVNVCNSWQIEGMKVTAHVVTYWDAKSKGIVQHGVNNLGGYGEHSVAYDPGTRTWTSADTIVDVAGDTVSGVNVISMADPDTLVVYQKERKYPGLSAESPKYPWKRLKPMGEMPANVRQKLNRVAGHTVSEVTWGDKTSRVETDGDWTPQGYSLVRQFTVLMANERVYGTNVMSWDAAGKCLISVNVFSNGDHDTTRWTDVDGDTWTGTGTGVFFGKPWQSETKLAWGIDRAIYEDTTDGKPFVSVTKLSR